MSTKPDMDHRSSTKLQAAIPPGIRKILLILTGTIGILCLGWWVILSPTHSGISPFSIGAWEGFWDFLDKLIGSDDPAYQKVANWKTIFGEMRETLTISLAGAILAGGASLLVLPFSITFSDRTSRKHKKNFTQEVRRLHPTNKTSNVGMDINMSSPGYISFPLKLSFVFTRTIPEVVWALLILLVWGPGLWGIVLAITVHNYGVLGRLFAGHLQANPPPAGGRLNTTGAGKVQSFIYGDLPLCTPQFLTLWLNRLEIILRSTVVLGFVSGAGLGLHLRLALSGRRFSEVALVLMAYFILILAVDLATTQLRRLIR